MIEARYLDIDSALGFVEIHTPEGTLPGDKLPTLLCLHTAGQSGVQWRRVCGGLTARGYRVVVPDLPGHGRSEPAMPGPVTDLVAYGDWLGKLLDILDIEKPYVLGCSIGGKLTLEMATRPDRPLSGAIAMAAEAGPGRVGLSGLRRELEDVAGPSRAERTYLGTLASVGRAMDPAAAHLAGLMHKREDPEISSSDLLGWGGHDVRDRLTDLTCPIHLVAGTDDPWIDADAVGEAADQINASTPGRARFSRLEAVGHYPMEEIDDFAGVAARWLADLRRPVQEHAAVTR
ncbi:UNVERIFIED_CONTAM: pimeloyl-ACP methyl ester carboxylesterase [Williamsia faeni]